MKLKILAIITVTCSLSLCIHAEEYTGSVDSKPVYHGDGINPNMKRLPGYTPLNFDTKDYDALEGQCHRGNLRRDGIFPVSGLRSIEGLKNDGVKWSFDTGGKVISSSVVSDNVLYIGTGAKAFIALDSETGKKKWSYKTKGAVYSSACLYREKVYFSDEAGYLYALNQSDGKEKWKVKVSSTPISASPGAAYGIIFSSEGRRGSSMFAASMSGILLYGFDPETGKKVYQPVGAKTIGGCQGLGSPAISEKTIISGGGQRYSHISLETGKTQALSNQGSATMCVGGISINKDGYIYYNTYSDGKLHVVWDSPKTLLRSQGMFLYPKQEKSDGEGGKYPGHEAGSQPIMTPNGKLFSTCYDGNLYTFNKSGKGKGHRTQWKRSWTFKFGGMNDGSKSSPSYADGVVYFGADNGNVYAVDAKSGKELWTFKTDGPVISSPWLGDGVVYIGSNDGKVYALGKPPKEDGDQEGEK